MALSVIVSLWICAMEHEAPGLLERCRPWKKASSDNECPTSWSLIISLIQLVLQESSSFKPRTLVVTFTHVVGVMTGRLTVASELWGGSSLVSLGPLGAFQRLGFKFPPRLIPSLAQLWARPPQARIRNHQWRPVKMYFSFVLNVFYLWVHIRLRI